MMWGPVAVIASPAVVSLGAAVVDPGSGFDPVSLIGTVITPVIVVGLFLAGKLHPHSEIVRMQETITRLLAEKAEKDVQLAATQTWMRDQAFPGMARAALVLETITPLLQTDVRLRPHRE